MGPSPQHVLFRKGVEGGKIQRREDRKSPCSAAGGGQEGAPGASKLTVLFFFKLRKQ